MNLPGWLQRAMAPAPDSLAAESIRRGKSPWTHGVHLLWTVWIFLTPLFGGGYGGKWVVLTLLSYPVFLWLYAKSVVAPRRGSWRYPLAMAVLSLALLRWYPSGLTYFVFGCVMLRVSARRPTLRAYLLQLLVLNAVYVAAAAWIGYPWQMLLWVPAMTLVIGVIVNVEHASQEKDAALALSHDEVRRLAATAERERIGRDLHDLLGHTLSLITLKLELARKLADRDPPASRLHVEEAERVARDALAQVRSAVTGIRSADLAAELASAKLMLESAQVQLEHDAPPDRLPPEVERGLALVLREAVTNIARHARASRARIGFLREADTLQLSIADDGRGGVAADGNGLAGMRDRVDALGGTLGIESPRGGGTRLLVRLPLAGREPVTALRLVPDPPGETGAVGVRA
jgi:two-component system sensor histidine kinase DesK